jgi:hypothetical protein
MVRAALFIRCVLTPAPVTDRLAYLNFVHGSLAANYAKKLNSSRTHLKSVRDEESALTPRRNVREGVKLQISKIKNDGQKGTAVEQKIAELENQLRRAESEDSDTEKQFEVLKRKALRENEEVKWSAVREVSQVVLQRCSVINTFELLSMPRSLSCWRMRPPPSSMLYLLFHPQLKTHTWVPRPRLPRERRCSPVSISG